MCGLPSIVESLFVFSPSFLMYLLKSVIGYFYSSLLVISMRFLIRNLEANQFSGIVPPVLGDLINLKTL